MNAIAAYQQTAAHTASPWKLIDMLFEGAIARIEKGEIEKAHTIVEEGLLASLDPSVPFSQGMANTYEAVLIHLSEGGNPQVAKKMLITLREAWMAINPGNK